MKIGDVVYFEETFSSAIIKGIVKEINDENIVTIQAVCQVDKKGRNVGGSYGTTGRYKQSVWTSYTEAYKARENNFDKQVEQLCEQINSVKDLIRFPLKHCLNGEEYTDYAAVKAYTIRAKELLDIEVK